MTIEYMKYNPVAHHNCARYSKDEDTGFFFRDDQGNWTSTIKNPASDENEILLNKNWYTTNEILDKNRTMMLQGDKMLLSNSNENYEMLMDKEGSVLFMSKGDIVAMDKNDSIILDEDQIHRMKKEMRRLKEDMLDINERDTVRYDSSDITSKEKKEMNKMIKKMLSMKHRMVKMKDTVIATVCHKS